MTIKIISLNVRGLRDENKRRSVFNYYRSRADILCLQETHCSQDIESCWGSEWGGIYIFANGESNARGVAILIKKNTPIMVENIKKCSSGRLVSCDLINVNNVQNKISIINIYAPNNDDPLFFEQLEKVIADGQSHKMVVGDFNLTLRPDIDRYNSVERHTKSVSKLQAIMNEWNLTDLWRVRNPTVRMYTWSRTQPNYTASRIDNILVTEGLTTMVENTTHLTGIRSDHTAVFCSVRIEQNIRGAGFWKMNTSLLTNTQFVIQMRQLIKNKIEEYEHLESPETWELLKVKIREFAQEFAKKNVEERKAKIADISEELSDLEQKVAEIPDHIKIKRMEFLRKELHELIEENTKSIIFRSKSKWYHLGEKGTKYFLNLEKSRFNARTCNAILKEDGNEITNHEQILKEQKAFYQKLYSKEEIAPFELINDQNIKISHDYKLTLDRPIEMNEIRQAVKSMKNGKTPGNDGIPVEFYKIFWADISELVFSAIKAGLENEQLHETARQGVLNLIPKQNKDTRILKNLRPITLLNVDYKIIEKIIATRFKEVMHCLIHNDQKGFMSDRRISVNIRKICDLITYTENNDIEAEIISLDFHKAFDTISFSCLRGALEFFNFGSQIINWTETLYRNFTVKIQNNGYFSDQINIERGLHQGGCCSSYYFLLCAELLAIQIRQNKLIKGISINQIMYLLGLFADDTDSYLSHDQQTMTELFRTIDIFGDVSGLRINYDKTSVYRIGSLKDSDAKLYTQKPIQWTNEPVNILGVWIDHNEQYMVELNYKHLLEKTEEILNRWSNRTLSLVGKIQVINSLVASLYVYRMSVLPTPPPQTLLQINNMYEKFLWKGKPKISLSLLQMPKQQGGLNLVDMLMKDRSLKIPWIKYLYEDEKMANLAYENINPCMKNYIWELNLKEKDVQDLGCVNTFWTSVLEAWADVNFIEEVLCPQEQIIWYNSHIKRRNKTLFWVGPYNKGLLRLKDLLNDDLKFKTDGMLQEQYNLSILQINTLKAAIPREWFKSLRNKIAIKETDNAEIINENKINELEIIRSVNPAKLAYGKLIKNKENKMNMMLRNKWNKFCIDNKVDCSLEEYKASLQSIQRTSNVPKLRSFQFRILMNAVVTNRQLYAWGRAGSNACSFCNLKKETVVHMLVECHYTRELWTNVWEEVKEKYPCDLQLSLSVENIMCDKVVQQTGHLYNFICLLVKQYIYRQRCLGEIPQ